MKDYCSRWSELTNADFKCGITSNSASGSIGTREAEAQGRHQDKSASVSCSYNNTTGMLYFSYSVWTTYNDGGVGCSLSGSGLFAVWLGTVNGE